MSNVYGNHPRRRESHASPIGQREHVLRITTSMDDEKQARAMLKFCLGHEVENDLKSNEQKIRGLLKKIGATQKEENTFMDVIVHQKSNKIILEESRHTPGQTRISLENVIKKLEDYSINLASENKGYME